MPDTEAIRNLNDQFRTSLIGGCIVATPGIVSRDDVSIIIGKVRKFDEFSPDNDPYGEHDFGSFEHDGETIFWKIDYYDNGLKAGSANPADASVTTRVLTVMLADEY